jgi:hypothetical protein
MQLEKESRGTVVPAPGGTILSQLTNSTILYLQNELSLTPN